MHRIYEESRDNKLSDEILVEHAKQNAKAQEQQELLATAENVVLFNSPEMKQETIVDTISNMVLKPVPFYERLFVEALEFLAERIRQPELELKFDYPLEEMHLKVNRENALHLVLLTSTVIEWHPVLMYYENYALERHSNVSSMALEKELQRLDEDELANPIFERELTEKELSFYHFIHNAKNDPRMEEFYELYEHFYNDESPSRDEVARTLDNAHKIFEEEFKTGLGDYHMFFRSLTYVEFERGEFLPSDNDLYDY
ncbi:MAG: hypothetical protein R2827_09985 [Bdellovibrionales bacterium]